MVALPLAPGVQAQSPPTVTPTVTQDVRLAATTVPPGGLITSFLGNQVTYCSIICPLLADTAVTAIATTLQTPGVLAGALRTGDLWKAIGITAASVTGPVNAAAQATILADGSLVAPRALNAFEVAVVGLMNIVPAALGGLPGIVAAIQTARQDTFTALNLPIVPNPTPTVMPRGVLQVAVVGAIDVVGAIIFPAFNHVLSAVFAVPDAVAQELAVTGDPVRALAAGFNTAARELTAAGTDIVDAVVTAVNNVRTEIEQSHPANRVAPPQERSSVTTTTPKRLVPDAVVPDAVVQHAVVPDPVVPGPVAAEPSRPSAPTTKHTDDGIGGAHRSPDATPESRDVMSRLRDTAREVVGKLSARPDHTGSGRPGISAATVTDTDTKADRKADGADRSPR
ncbi:MAG TPA: hypothetical protein VFL67_13405 [Mycobacterium sp.]|nr:hypothetical protein [Mycobacterium sp.]